jgi:hypothetical protein
MTRVEVFEIEKVGSDYILLGSGAGQVRVNFANDEMFSKEDNAAFFLRLRGKPAAIPVNGPFFIAVDFWRDRFDGSLRVVPFNFSLAGIERSQSPSLTPYSVPS